MKSKIPPQWKKDGLTYDIRLTLEKAKKMLEAGEKEGERQNVPITIAIVDAGGNMIAFHRMDNAILCSIQIAIDKAYTAVLSKLSTIALGKPFKSGEMTPLFFHERWITLPGGFPIIDNGVILGGIGASGGKAYEDCFVVHAALKAGGFDLSDVSTFISELENEAKLE